MGRASTVDGVDAGRLAFARAATALLVLVVVAGGAVRLWALDGRGFWLDELATAVGFADPGRPFLDLLTREIVKDNNPPLYYALAWLWRRAFGPDEWTARLLSVVASLAGLALAVFWPGDGLARRQKLALAALLAGSHAAVFYAVEARNYALLITLCTGVLLAGQDAAGRLVAGRPIGAGPLLALFGFGALAAYTHYFGLLNAGAAVLLLAAAALGLRRPADALRLAATGTAVFAALLPWLAFTLARRPSMDSGFMETGLVWLTKAFAKFAFMTAGDAPLLLGLAGLLLGHLAAVAVARRGRRDLPVLLPYALALLTSALALAVSFAVTPVITFRNLLAALPAVCLAAVFALDALERRMTAGAAPTGVLAAGVALLMLAGSAEAMTRRPVSGWRPSAAFVRGLDDVRACDGAEVVGYGGWTDFTRYYLNGRPTMRFVGVGVGARPEEARATLRGLRGGTCPVLVWATHVWPEQFAGLLRALDLHPRARDVHDFGDVYVVLRP